MLVMGDWCTPPLLIERDTMAKCDIKRTIEMDGFLGQIGLWRRSKKHGEIWLVKTKSNTKMWIGLPYGFSEQEVGYVLEYDGHTYRIIDKKG